jgi:hypothetical protein
VFTGCSLVTAVVKFLISRLLPSNVKLHATIMILLSRVHICIRSAYLFKTWIRDHDTAVWWQCSPICIFYAYISVFTHQPCITSWVLAPMAPIVTMSLQLQLGAASEGKSGGGFWACAAQEAMIQSDDRENAPSQLSEARVFRRESPPTRSRRSTGSGGESSSMLTSVEGNAVQGRMFL